MDLRASAPAQRIGYRLIDPADHPVLMQEKALKPQPYSSEKIHAAPRKPRSNAS